MIKVKYLADYIDEFIEENTSLSNSSRNREK